VLAVLERSIVIGMRAAYDFSSVLAMNARHALWYRRVYELTDRGEDGGYASSCVVSFFSRRASSSLSQRARLSSLRMCPKARMAPKLDIMQYVENSKVPGSRSPG
jgi:hypothetical protein